MMLKLLKLIKRQIYLYKHDLEDDRLPQGGNHRHHDKRLLPCQEKEPEHERWCRRLIAARYAPDLATLNREMPTYERSGTTLTPVTSADGAALSKLTLAMSSCTGHKDLGKLLDDASAPITIVTSFGLTKKQDKGKKSYPATASQGFGKLV